jgi:hypothetical protein
MAARRESIFLLMRRRRGADVQFTASNFVRSTPRGPELFLLTADGALNAVIPNVGGRSQL